jgi:hypothetical protein
MVLAEIPQEVLASRLQLPRLRHLHLWRPGEYPLWEEEYARLLALVQPTFEELHCDITPALVQRLAAQHLGRLRSLIVYAFVTPQLKVAVDGLIEWLARRPLLPLQTVSLPSLPFDDFDFTDRAFCLYAQWPGLRELRFAGGIPHLGLASVLKAKSMPGDPDGDQQRQPFGQLRSLEITIFTEAAPALADMLHCVTDLTLRTIGEDPVRPAVAGLTKLRSLEVAVGRAGPQCRLTVIRYLTKLRRLVLSGGSAYDGYFAVLVDLLGDLSLLEVLKLPLGKAIDPMLLVHIGSLYPKLHTLELTHVRTSLAAVVESDCNSVHFPNLRQFTAGMFYGPHLGPRCVWTPPL